MAGFARVLGPAFAPSGDLRSDVREIVHRAVYIFVNHSSRTQPHGIDDDVSDRATDDREDHGQFLSGAVTRLAAAYEYDAKFIVDVIEGTFRYRSLLGKPITLELADQLADLLCGHLEQVELSS